MQVLIRLFAFYRDQAGSDRIRLTLGENATVSAAIQELLTQFESIPKNFMPHLMAVNEQFANLDYPLHEGDEIAFYPPVSGGVDAELTHENIHPEHVSALVQRPGNGAVVTFEGVTRNQTRGNRVLYLEYEAHEPVARKALSQILEEASHRFNVHNLAVKHRLGRMEIGDHSLILAVGSPHRKEAFEAAQFIVDRIKHIVPIWKKEYFQDGSFWVGLASEDE
jgi:molybdopterin synthase catalytic subunit/molybdopterin converting factor small subunit